VTDSVKPTLTRKELDEIEAEWEGTSYSAGPNYAQSKFFRLLEIARAGLADTERLDALQEASDGPGEIKGSVEGCPAYVRVEWSIRRGAEYTNPVLPCPDLREIIDSRTMGSGQRSPSGGSDA
jgi:hypothetical protein